MESFFVRFKNSLVLVTVLLAQIIGLAVQVRRPVGRDEPDGQKVYLLRAWTIAALSPFERLAHRAGLGVRGAWSNYLDLRHTRQENEALQGEIARMRLEQAAFAEDAIQGHRLQTLLDFQQHYIARTMAAQVIGTSGSDQSRMLILDKGAADGLKPDMAVITPDGIVGKLRDVFSHTSQLLLVNDATAGAGVVLQTTRIRAILRGTATGRLQIGNLTADSRIKPGEAVLTSGGDLVYPRGLKVGVVESIAPDPEHQPYMAITVKPSANLFQLEEVLIITETQSSIPAQARQDLAQGAATAEILSAQAAEAARAAQAAQAADAERAADLLAERLPSIHDGEPGTADGKPADPNAAATPDATKQPGGTVPKPLPTIHPDHFSPGTTPPAASLTPGASATSPAAPATVDGDGEPAVPAAIPRRTPRTRSPSAPPAQKPATEPPQ